MGLKNIPWAIKRWFFITLLVLVEFMSCLSVKSFQPWSTLGGCLLMFGFAYWMSTGFSLSWLKSRPFSLQDDSDIVTDLGRVKKFSFRHIIDDPKNGRGVVKVYCPKTKHEYQHTIIAPNKFALLCPNALRMDIVEIFSAWG
jgi:hypothetical protein